MLKMAVGIYQNQGSDADGKWGVNLSIAGANHSIIRLTPPRFDNSTQAAKAARSIVKRGCEFNLSQGVKAYLQIQKGKAPTDLEGATIHLSKREKVDVATLKRNLKEEFYGVDEGAPRGDRTVVAEKDPSDDDGGFMDRINKLTGAVEVPDDDEESIEELDEDDEDDWDPEEEEDVDFEDEDEYDEDEDDEEEEDEYAELYDNLRPRISKKKGLKSFEQIQGEIVEWSRKNFGENATPYLKLKALDQPSIDSPIQACLGSMNALMGIGEEIGELMEADILNDYEGYVDSAGDILVYLSDYTGREHYSLKIMDDPKQLRKAYQIMQKEMGEVMERNMPMAYGKLLRCTIKRHQNIRGHDKEDYYVKRRNFAIVSLIHAIIMDYNWGLARITLLEALNETWEQVQERNWKKNPHDGVGSPSKDTFA
jgi:hypothetical protein